MNKGGPAVVAGVDGSEQSVRAARWAAGEAAMRRLPLHLLLVNDDPMRTDYCDTALADAVRQCLEVAPGLEVTTEITFGHPVEELVHVSGRAPLVVIGSRGHGGFLDAMLGSVGAAVASHGGCPVIVTRGTSGSGPVVVGVDNSRGSRTALEFAFDEASRRQTGLVAVQALPDAYFHPGPFPHPDREELRAAADRHLAEQLTGWSEKYPDVEVRKIATNEHPVAALGEAAQGAQLLVVGHRGRGGFTGMLLGSVATGVLHHAPCPVAVVRTDRGS